MQKTKLSLSLGQDPVNEVTFPKGDACGIEQNDDDDDLQDGTHHPPPLPVYERLP
jgi:hypothetical protein